jgi:hypothetical protein
MSAGPGKYDGLATMVREQADARGVIVIVIEGDNGSGFSVQGDLSVTLRLPAMLRNMADQIEKDILSS